VRGVEVAPKRGVAFDMSRGQESRQPRAKGLLSIQHSTLQVEALGYECEEVGVCNEASCPVLVDIQLGPHLIPSHAPSQPSHLQL